MIGGAVLLIALVIWRPWGAYFGPATPVQHHGTISDAYAFAASVGGRVETVLTNETFSSMSPNISLGDAVICRPKAFADLVVGDIVVRVGVAPDGGQTYHRLKSRNPDGSFRTEGDSNPSADQQPMTEADYRGFVITDTFRP